MNVIKRFNNLSLSLKVNIVLVMMLAFLLATTLFVLETNINTFTLQTGQQRLAQEVTINQNRFVEAEREILLATKLLATTPRLTSALETGDTLAVRLGMLTTANTLGLDAIEIIDAAGERVSSLTSRGLTENEQATADLRSLGLAGTEATMITYDETEVGEMALLTAVVPLQNASGEIIGAVLSKRDIDDEFLTTINLAQDEVTIGLISHGRLAASSDTIHEHTETATAATHAAGTFHNIPLDHTSIEQALQGNVVISDGVFYTEDGQPNTLAYSPISHANIPDQPVIVTLVTLDKLFAFQQGLTANMAAILTILTLITVLIGAFLARKFITAPMAKLKLVAEHISRGDYAPRAEVKSADEIGQLAATFNQMTDALQKTIEAEQQSREEAEIANEAMSIQIWQTSGQSRLNEKMQGVLNVASLADRVIHQLCQYVQAEIGALYVVEGDYLNLVGSFANNGATAVSQFKIGEGLVGQAAKEKEPQLLVETPQDHLIIRSGFSENVPGHIMVFPFMYEERVVGVIEMGTLTTFDQPKLEFVQNALANIAIGFNTAQARARIDELLTQTQNQAEELQAQGEELRVANEELEAQTQSLRVSEGRLKEKQLELESTNAQLEEKAAALEESSLNLYEKQSILDKQNQELRQAQAELEQKAEELALASKYKSEFLANMSHELRTPLNSLLILARILAENEEGNLSEEQVEAAQIIYGGGNDLLNLINDILDLSKVESGKMVFNIEPMALVDLVNILQSQFNHVADEKRLAFNINLESNVPAIIKTDQQRVAQIVRNLLSNAFKFTAEGSVNLTIALPSEQVDLTAYGLAVEEAIAIRIADTGIGMRPEQKKIIFEAFQQADGSTSRQYGGTGLGLSISRELTTKLGGQILVESERGVGSTFTLYLPLESQVPVAEQTAVSVVTPKAKVGPVATNGTPATAVPPAPRRIVSQPMPDDDRAELQDGDKKLLLIEDDPKFAKILYKHAHKKGFKCLIAGTGTTALNLLKNYQPDAVLLDLNLPDMSGWEILEKIKGEPRTRHIPVHIISVEDEVLDAYRKGAMGYLTKPVDRENLEISFQNIEHVIDKDIKSLLLVEDDATARIGIKRLLGGSDVQIIEAAHGKEALEKIRTEVFDCIILDLSLPDMTGFELLNQLNTDDAVPKCPVIVYTGRELSAAENNELMRYADSVIVKGVKSPERLLDETALFLHRVVAEMPEEKQQTIKQLYSLDGLLKDKKVLIVDDDMRNSFALSKLLSDKGVKVQIAPDGEEALALLEKEPTDLVLMDIMMPGIDGYETIRRIRKQPKFRELPILALTAKAMKGDREKCLAAGANDYLPKPIDIDRLFSMLRVWLYQ